MLSTLVVLLVLPAAALSMFCEAGDFVSEIGCKSFDKCEDGKESRVECVNGTVYNQDKKACDEVTNVAPPCGHWVDCSEKENKSFADVHNKCKSYYTCQYGNFLGHNFCPNGLVFSEDKQGCRLPATVEAPCGTKPVPLDMNCTSVGDGNFEIGCKTYTKCENGKESHVECVNGTVYNHAVNGCDDPSNTAPPCGHMVDCSVKENKRFADMDNGCKSFYTCQNGNTLGPNLCPVGWVFSELKQGCRWPGTVEAPCGTKPVKALGMNCTSVGDGNFEIGCKTYTKCEDGKESHVECVKGTVYNHAVDGCDDPTNTAPPCGHMVNCYAKEDKRFADMDNGCKSFYTCQYGKFLGHNFCPVGTVFSEDRQACRWAFTVEAPCGTKPAGRRR